MALAMTFEDVVMFVTDHHHGQKDKVGEPYILHLFRVMLKMDTPAEREVALLHDLVEDTFVSLTDLEAWFSKETIEAVDHLTRREKESYADFIRRCKQNELARQVKIADVEDHLEQSCITGVLSESKRSDYAVALARLKLQT